MKLQFLKQLSLFSHLGKPSLTALAASVEQKSYIKNEIIFQEGEPADKLFMICDGAVKIFKSNVEGQVHILHIMQKNSIIAEVPMFAGGSYPANCAALEDSILFAIPRQKFISLIKSDPHMALSILALQAERLREFACKIEQLSLKTTEQKFLNFLAKNSHAENNIIIAKTNNLNIQELANYLGTARENLSRVINKLINNKVIKKCKDGFILSCSIKNLYF